MIKTKHCPRRTPCSCKQPKASPLDTSHIPSAKSAKKEDRRKLTQPFSPVGLEAVRGLAEAGADVALMYSTSTQASSLASQIALETGVKVHAYQADVRSADSLAATINQIATDFGRLDIVVANAGITSHVSALEQSKESYENVMRINLDGAFWTAQAAGKIFEKQGSGSLIFTASVSAILVNLPQKQAAYNASKAAVVQLAKCLAVEWAGWGRVNCVSPGFIATDSELRVSSYLVQT